MSTTIFPVSIPSKRLAASITASSSSFQLNNILGWDGNALTSADFGTIAYVVFRNDANTLMEIMEIDPSTIASASITISKRGLKFTGDLTTEVTANKLVWIKNETIVELGSDVPQLLKSLVDIYSAQTIAGIKTFSSLPSTTAGDPVATTDLARKAYVDSVVAGIATSISNVVPGTAGETLADGNLVYLKTSDNRWWKTDADTTTTVENVMLGIAQGAGTTGAAITNGVLTRGVDDAQSGLVAGEVQYASNTAGAIANAAGTTEVTVGVAKSTTELYFDPRFNQQLTEDQQDALAGTSGTPSASNKFVTDADTRLVATDNSRTTGEAIDGSTTPQAVCIVASDGLVYKADANVNTKVSAYGFVTTNASITTTPAVSIRGIVAGFTGLTIGAMYYVSDTAGSISTTPSTTTSIPVGIAISATQLSIIIGKKIAYGTITHTSAAAGTQNVVTTIGFAPSTIILNVSISVTGDFTATLSSIANFFSTTLMSALGLQSCPFSTNAITFVKFATQIKTGLTITSQKTDFDSAEGATTNWATAALTMNAVSATGFTTRIVNTTGAGAGGNASGSLKYTAIE